MADIAIQEITKTGTAITFQAAIAGGDRIPNNLEGERTFLRVKNTDASSKTVTINSQKTCDMGFDHDLAIVVPATTGDSLIGPLPDDRFNDGTGAVAITYSSVTGVTVAALKLPE